MGVKLFVPSENDDEQIDITRVAIKTGRERGDVETWMYIHDVCASV